MGAEKNVDEREVNFLKTPAALAKPQYGFCHTF